MLAAISTHAINATLIPDLKYDPLKDFTPITLLFSYPSVVAVPANSPTRTLADLVEMARNVAETMLTEHADLAERHLQRWLGSREELLKS